VVVPALMAAMAYRASPNNKWLAAALAVIFSLAAAYMAWGPDKDDNPARSLDLDIGPMIAFGLASAGAGLADIAERTLGQLGISIDTRPAAGLIGFTLLALTGSLAVRLWALKAGRTGRSAVAMTGAFAVLAVVILALGRNDTAANPDIAFSSHYGPFSASLLCALIVLTAVSFKLGKSQQAAGLLVLGLIASVVPVYGAAFAAADRHADSRVTIRADLVQEVEARIITMLPQFRERSREIRDATKWHFADPWSHRLGERIEIAQAAACGAVEKVEPVWGQRKFMLIRGSVARAQALRARTVLVVDRTRRIVGYGGVPRRADDLIPWQVRPSVSWRAFAQTRSYMTGPLFVYLADENAIVCRAGVTTPE
jgi:hypothetical protein